MNQETQKKLLQIVKENYESIAEGFNETRKKAVWPELAKLCDKYLHAGDKVLDVGCGNGRLLDSIGERAIDYLGVDNSQNLIRLAQERYLQTGVRFEVQDVLDLNMVSDYNFDIVFSIAMIHHLPGEKLQIDALRQMKSKLRPGGKIILSAWNLWSHKKFRSLILKFHLLKFIGKNQMDFGDILFDWKNSQGEKVSKRYYHAFRLGELKKLAIKSGLKVIDVYRDKYNIYLVAEK